MLCVTALAAADGKSPDSRPDQTWSGHERGVTCVAFGPDGKWLVTGGGDDALRIRDAASGKELRSVTAGGDGVMAVAVSPDGKHLAAGCGNKVLVWDLAK